MMLFAVMAILVIAYLIRIMTVGMNQMRMDEEMEKIRQENSRRTQEIMKGVKNG